MWKRLVVSHLESLLSIDELTRYVYLPSCWDLRRLQGYAWAQALAPKARRIRVLSSWHASWSGARTANPHVGSISLLALPSVVGTFSATETNHNRVRADRILYWHWLGQRILTFRTAKQRSSSSAFKAHSPSLDAKEHHTDRVSCATAQALACGKAWLQSQVQKINAMREQT